MNKQSWYAGVQNITGGLQGLGQALTRLGDRRREQEYHSRRMQNMDMENEASKLKLEELRAQKADQEKEFAPRGGQAYNALATTKQVPKTRIVNGRQEQYYPAVTERDLVGELSRRQPGHTPNTIRTEGKYGSEYTSQPIPSIGDSGEGMTVEQMRESLGKAWAPTIADEKTIHEYGAGIGVARQKAGSAARIQARADAETERRHKAEEADNLSRILNSLDMDIRTKEQQGAKPGDDPALAEAMFHRDNIRRALAERTGQPFQPYAPPVVPPKPQEEPEYPGMFGGNFRVQNPEWLEAILGPLQEKWRGVRGLYDEWNKPRF